MRDVNALLDYLEENIETPEDDWPELRICLACGMPGERRVNDAGESFCKHCGGRDHMPPLPAILATAGRAPFQGGAL